MRSLIDGHPDEPYVLVYGDIDRFKVYNDLFGTPAGDRLLADIGDMIRDLMPEGAVAARLRADHFVCCCPRSSFNPDHMLAALDAWFSAYREDFTFFVRLGVYAIDDPSLDVSLMCDRALLALRSAKSGNAGSKYVFYDEQLRSSVLKEQELAGEMIAALESGQIVPYFQPQYHYATGAMIGAEVLARWNHPVKGLLGPLEFIPVFERNGLIATFDYYIWEQACRCLRTWIDERGQQHVPRLSVNLSRADIYRSDLCAYLSELVARYDIPCSLLHLEITESAYMEAPEQLIEAVRKLQAAGFIVEMDDFGSGYSSLNTLKDVPVDVLKLDMGFLDACASSRGGLILASIVRMARWLDLPTIAEGVETQAQAAYLASVGCEYMQGYLFSKPVDQKAFERLLDEGKLTEMEWSCTEKRQDDAAGFWNAESQMALIFNSFVGAAAIAEFDGVGLEIVRANDRFDQLFGLSEDPSYGARVRKDLLAMLREEDRLAFVDALSDATADEEAECEFRYRTGEVVGRWIRIRVRLLSRAGDVRSVYLSAEETTEQKALRDRLATTTNTIPGGLSFYELGESMRLLDFSDTAAELVDCTREEYEAWAKGDALSVVLDEDRPVVEEILARLRGGADRATFTLRAQKHGGDFIWVHVSASVLYRGEGTLYIVAVYIDVTQQKMNEQRLKAQYEMQMRLSDAIPCGIVRYTVENEPRMLFMNKRALGTIGFASFEEFIEESGGRALMPIHEEDVPRHRKTIEELKQGSAPIDFTYRYYRRDGSVGWLEGTSALEEGLDGEPVVQSAFIDITEQKQESHERDLQRYATVLCSVYEEIFEFDGERGTYRLLYSSKRPVSGAALPFDEALNRWLAHLPSTDDQVSLRLAIEECRRSDGRKPILCTYKIALGDEPAWCQSTFLRVSPTSILCCNKDVTTRLTEEDRKVVTRVADAMGKLPVGVGIYTLRDDTIYPLYVNDLMCTMFGFTAQEYAERIERGLPVLTNVDVSNLMKRYDPTTILEEGIDAELETKRRDGSPIAVRIQGRVLREEHGGITLYAVVADVTAERRVRHERAWQNERYRLLSEMTHAISFDYDSDADTVLLYIDRTGKGMEAQVIPHYLETLTNTRESVVHPDSMQPVREMFEKVRAGAKEVAIEYQADYYGRGYAWYRANLFVVHDDEGAWHLVGLIENIDQERALRFKAEYDATTGLSNHAATQDLITAALADAQVRESSICVVLDIDDFKWVNDNSGHLEGDMLLHTVGTVLRSNFRESDIIGRVGGDEFVLLLKRIDLDTALRHLEQVRSQISATKVPGLDRSPSVSAGVYATSPSDLAYRDVFVKADEALYQAKRAGKNRIQVYRSDGLPENL